MEPLSTLPFVVHIDYLDEPGDMVDALSLEVLVAITTNEPLHNFHPAIVRPGRCLAEIEVGRLPRAEAATGWGPAPASGLRGPRWPSSTPCGTGSTR